MFVFGGGKDEKEEGEKEVEELHFDRIGLFEFLFELLRIAKGVVNCSIFFFFINFKL